MPAYYYYGRTSSLSGQKLPEGVRALERYIAYEPHEGEPPRSSAHYRLGLVYEWMGDRQKARSEFETSLRLEPTRSEVKTALRRWCDYEIVARTKPSRNTQVSPRMRTGSVTAPPLNRTCAALARLYAK